VDRRTAGRQLALLLTVFLATLILLAASRLVLERTAAGNRGSPGPSAVGAVPPPSVGPSGAIPPPSLGRSASAGTANPTLPPAANPDASDAPTITLTGAGDIGDCGRDGAGRTADLLGRQSGWFFTAGDNAYADGSASDYRRCYAPTWGRFLDRTILAVVGNHDWETAGAAGYLDYFGARAAPAGTTWYSMDLGTWHVVVLDSACDHVGGCDAGSPQGRWLAADLRASPARCTLAIWHRPRFSSGEHGDAADVGPFWQLLHEDGAELVINGHDHDYERFAPQDPSGREERPGGIREIVVGTGGGVLRSFTHETPNSEFRLAGTYGVLRLTLHPFNYDWEFLPVSGAISDAGSTPCR